MKRRPFLFLLCIIITLIVSPSCKQKAGGSGEAYTLKMQLNKGDRFGQDMDMDMKMAFNMAGQQMDMNMVLKGTTLFEVINASNEIKELAMTYTKMKTSVEMKGPDGINKEMGNKDAGNRIVGKTVTLKMNNKNEIVEIAGIEGLMWGDSTDMAAREQMKKMFSKEQMNGLFGMMFRMYPDKPVRVGESWQKESDVSVAGINMRMLAEYVLTSVKNGVAFVDVHGKYKGKGKMNPGGVELEMEMDGEQKGNINIGLADGYLKDSQVTMDIKAGMNMMGQKIPVTVKGYYLIKGN